jgi:hypothetical protein
MDPVRGCLEHLRKYLCSARVIKGIELIPRELEIIYLVRINIMLMGYEKHCSMYGELGNLQARNLDL